MPVHNAAEVEKAKKPFEIQLDKDQIKDLKEHIKAVERLKKEAAAPIAISDNIVAEMWIEDAYFDALPTTKADEIDAHTWIAVARIKKAKKSSNPSKVEQLLMFLWEHSELIDTYEMLTMEPFKTEIEKREAAIKSMCQSLNVFMVNAAGLSKKKGEEFLEVLLGLTFTESDVFIDGLLKGNRMIVE